MHLGNYAELQDFIVASEHEGRWPNTIPEAEQLLVQCLSNLLLSRSFAGSNSEWLELASRRGFDSGLVLRMPGPASIPIFSDMPGSVLHVIARESPALAWSLRPSTMKLHGNYSGYFTGSRYRLMMIALEQALANERSRQEFLEVNRLLLELAVGVSVSMYAGSWIRVLLPDIPELGHEMAIKIVEILLIGLLTYRHKQ